MYFKLLSYYGTVWTEWKYQPLQTMFFSKTILTPHCNMLKFKTLITLQIFIWILTHLISFGQILKDFKKYMGGHKSFLWGHWYPCFGLLVMSPLGFKARVDSLICTWQRHIFPKIDLWCNTFAGVYGQHSDQSVSSHVCFSRGRIPDSNGRIAVRRTIHSTRTYPAKNHFVTMIISIIS